jgi:hypothetical protein
MSVVYSAFTQLIAVIDFTAFSCCSNFILLYESIAFLFKKVFSHFNNLKVNPQRILVYVPFRLSDIYPI